MKDFINKVIALVVAPLVTIILGILKVPASAAKIAAYPKLVGFLDWFVIGGTALVTYFSIWAPYKLYEKSRARKWEVMKDQSDRLNKDYEDKYEFNFNIMLSHWSILHFYEPTKKHPQKSKWTWFGKIFRISRDWGKETVPKQLKISVNQGVCGRAYRDGVETSVKNIVGFAFLPELMADQDFNFTEKQKRLTKELIIVVSCPLVIKDKTGDTQKVKTIGVFNVESKVLDSAQLFLDPTAKVKFYDKVANLAKLFITLHV